MASSKLDDGTPMFLDQLPYRTLRKPAVAQIDKDLALYFRHSAKIDDASTPPLHRTWMNNGTVRKQHVPASMDAAGREDAHLLNRTSSRLYNVPVELILEIAHWLSPEPRVMLQRVCSKFRVALAPTGFAPEITKNILTSWDLFRSATRTRNDLEAALQRSWLLRSDPHDLLLNSAGCSGCRKTHSRNWFSSKQLNLPASDRVCLGLEGTITLCGHYHFSGRCLLRALREMKDTEVHCNKNHNAVWNKRWVANSIPARPHIGFHGGKIITIDRQTPILVVPFNKEVTQDSLASALRAIGIYICPHLYSRTSQLFNGNGMTVDLAKEMGKKIRAARAIGQNYGNDDENILLRKADSVSWSKCPNNNCLTRYCLRRITSMISPFQHAIVFEVSRDIKGDPVHPSWQAQLSKGNDRILKSSTCNVLEEAGRCQGQCCLYRYSLFATKEV